MIKILASLLLILLLVLPAFAQESSLHPAGILTLESGDEVEETFEETGIGYIYGFLASAGDLVTIRMEPLPNSPLDPFLVLISAEGGILASNDDVSTGANLQISAAIVDFAIPADGSYFILATRPPYQLSDYPPLKSEGFTLSLEGNTPPGGDSDAKLQISTIEAKVDETYTLSTSADQPIQFFHLETDFALVDLTVESDAFDPVVLAFYPDSIGALYHDDIDLESNHNARIEGLDMFLSGNYLILVTGYNFPFATTEGWDEYGEYTFKVEPTSFN